MIRRLLCCFLVVIFPAYVSAQTVRVTSGEHDGFTRLVFDYGTPVEWQVGRNSDGYTLRVQSGSRAYDLDGIFAVIGKTRLAALSQEPETGDIKISLACPCHVFPFEFRAGILVVDLKDGPPPKGSSFEESLSEARQDRFVARPRPRPDTAAGIESVGTQENYNWINLEGKKNSEDQTPFEISDANSTRTSPLETGLDLHPLRETLIENLSRGASQGIVEIAKPVAKPMTPENSFPSAQIRIGPAKTGITRDNTAVNDTLGAKGETCVDDSSLALETWGDETLPFLGQISENRVGLTGEFDRPNPEAVEKLVKLYLYLGFGAEARELARTLASEASNTHIWQSLGSLIDGDFDTENVFLGQAACDGHVALWGLLAEREVQKGDMVNEGAVRLAFSALPLHLRKLLGPILADRFTAMENPDAARALLNSITRAESEKEASAPLMEADLSLKAGESEAAEAIASTLLADPGREHPNALIAFTKARVAQGLPISKEIVVALEAFGKDYAGTELEDQIEEALMLALASSGEFDPAFAKLVNFPKQLNNVWSILVAQADDDTFLSHAVLLDDTRLPMVAEETGLAVARRLSGLGLGTAAAHWLSGIEDPDPILSAQIALQNRDGAAALALIAGREDKVASEIRLQSLDLVGENKLKAKAMLESGDEAAAALAFAKEADWQSVALLEQTAWKALASDVATRSADAAPVSTQGLTLENAHELVLLGESSRAEIKDLLDAFPAPKQDLVTGW